MGVKEQITTTSTSDDIAKMGVGQGELYSPDHAIRIDVLDSNNNKKKQGQQQLGGGEDIRKEKMVRGVAADIRKNLGTMKEKVLEKLAAASVPADALENARHFFESVIRDVTVAAHGLTKDALLRIKTHLVDLLPSLSPNITKKMVDDAEKEVNGQRGSESEGEEEIEESNRQKQDGDDHQTAGGSSKAPFLSPTSSLFSSLVKPLSRL